MLNVALEAARAGADLLRQVQPYRQVASIKQPADYVTEFDYRSEEAIIEVLERLAPGIPVLSEERGGKVTSTMWTVDPLDGTTNFIHGLPIVAVSVALVSDGVPELGIVIAPWMNLEFTAQRGKGISRNGETLPRPNNVDPAKAIIATGFPIRGKKQRLPQYEAVFSKALRRFEDLRRAGSSALDMCWTATGIFDGFFELELGTWDVAAGAAFVLEAGGKVSDWSGGNSWLESGDIVAGPPSIHEALLELTAAGVD